MFEIYFLIIAFLGLQCLIVLFETNRLILLTES